MPLMDYPRFASAFVSNPMQIGAVAPSSSRLAREVVGWIDWPCVDTVLEYGPGTGVFTRVILASKRPDARFIAIENHAVFVDVLKARFPGLTVSNDSVNCVQSICKVQGIHSIDAIVSGLPWASFSDRQQVALLESTLGVLKRGGQFTTFAYLHGLLIPAARRFADRLRDAFTEVEMSRTVWRNLPPAFIYRCRY